MPGCPPFCFPGASFPGRVVGWYRKVTEYRGQQGSPGAPCFLAHRGLLSALEASSGSNGKRSLEELSASPLTQLYAYLVLTLRVAKLPSTAGTPESVFGGPHKHYMQMWPHVVQLCPGHAHAPLARWPSITNHKIKMIQNFKRASAEH